MAGGHLTASLIAANAAYTVAAYTVAAYTVQCRSARTAQNWANPSPAYHAR
jgi:hypothetical protein